MSKRKLSHEYDLVVGRTVKEVHNWSHPYASTLAFEFEDGTCLVLWGTASGHDVEFAGVSCEFFQDVTKAEQDHIIDF